MVAIKQQLVAVRSLTSGVGNPCNYITIHETANTAKGANAQSHANLQSKGNSRLASWHYQVDDKEIIQSFLDYVQCWHAGDGQGKGNMESIGIEICVNSDGNFKNAIKNAAELVKYLMKKHDIGISNVVQHSRWSGKDCPHNLRDGSKGINWNDFIGLVKGTTSVHVPTQEVGSAVITKPSTKTIDQLADEVIAGKHGSGADRKKALGSQYDAVQKRVNEKLLGSQPKPATKSIDQLVKETLAGKHGNGEQRKKSLGKNYQAVQEIINGKTTTASKPASKPKGSGSGKYGKLKIVGVSSAAIVMDSPDRNKAKNLGTVKLGATLPLNGSVKGKNSDSGYWEVQYKGKLGYITGKFGKRV